MSSEGHNPNPNPNWKALEDVIKGKNLMGQRIQILRKQKWIAGVDHQIFLFDEIVWPFDAYLMPI